MKEKTRGRPKKQNGDVLKTCAVRLPPKLLEEIREVSEQTDRSMGNIIGRILETYLPDYRTKELYAGKTRRMLPRPMSFQPRH